MYICIWPPTTTNYTKYKLIKCYHLHCSIYYLLHVLAHVLDLLQAVSLDTSHVTKCSNTDPYWH
jgi:hypothetical protein